MDAVYDGAASSLQSRGSCRNSPASTAQFREVMFIIISCGRLGRRSSFRRRRAVGVRAGFRRLSLGTFGGRRRGHADRHDHDHRGHPTMDLCRARFLQYDIASIPRRLVHRALARLQARAVRPIPRRTRCLHGSWWSLRAGSVRRPDPVRRAERLERDGAPTAIPFLNAPIVIARRHLRRQHDV